MTTSVIASTVEIFVSRLTTLEHLLQVGAEHFRDEGDRYLSGRLTEDMFPLGTQIAFTCNQPRNFALWIQRAAASDLDPNVQSLATGLRYIQETKHLLKTVNTADAVLPSRKHLQLGAELYADLTGHQYLNEFLMPNFYFHLVTAYAVLRMSGVQLGKHDYMRHLMPHVKQTTA
jgi:hypothetical protein